MVLVMTLLTAAGATALVLRPQISVAAAAVREATDEVRPGGGTTLQEARGLHVYLVPHPDDELSAWTSLTDDEDLYPVVVLLTQGGATTRCQPERFVSRFEEELGEVAPEPRPDRDTGVAACKAARLSSFRTHLTAAAVTSPDVAGLGAASLVELPGGVSGRYATGDGATLVVLDLPDGALTPQAARTAVEQVLAVLGPALGDLQLVRVTASAYATGRATEDGGRCGRPALCPANEAPFHYPNEDHLAAREAARSLAPQAQEGSWLVTSTYDPAASVFRTLPQDVYDEFMALGPGDPAEAQRLGSYQRSYGWLAFPNVWHRGDLPLASNEVLFSRVQSYEVVAP